MVRGDGRKDVILDLGDGRRVGFVDGGDPTGLPVVWCHGGPGSRLDPAWLDSAARRAGLRIISFDRPGYGRSTPRPGRTIADGVVDLIEVVDHLGVERFVTVGVSTGGAYALAAAALVPGRVRGVVACAAMTDMAWGPCRATMDVVHVGAIWDAPDRSAALVAAEVAYGTGFSKLRDGGMRSVMASSDMELFADPVWMEPAMAGFAEMSVHGLQGYVDDRIADGGGWSSFDIADVTCPVVVLHGRLDRMVDVSHAHHTAQIVGHAELDVIDDAGHFSIERHVLAAIARATH